MTGPVTFPGANASGIASFARVNVSPSDTNASNIGERFEQMLWAEMLTHAGLEKAFSQGGGESASAFSRYVVEAVAKDIAASHPLGLADAVKYNRQPQSLPSEHRADMETIVRLSTENSAHFQAIRNGLRHAVERLESLHSSAYVGSYAQNGRKIPFTEVTGQFRTKA